MLIQINQYHNNLKIVTHNKKIIKVINSLPVFYKEHSTYIIDKQYYSLLLNKLYYLNITIIKHNITT